MLKTAIIGLGWWGGCLASFLKESTKIEIVAGADIDAGRRQTWAQQTGLPVRETFEAVLADRGIEAVVLATPHSLHERQVLAAVDAGKQVFCEKPLSLDVASARRIISACEAADIVLGIGHERRYEPANEELVRLIKSGELGTILHVEGHHSHDKLADLGATSWRGNPAEAPAAGWTGMGIHLTDLFMSALGPVTEVFAYTASRASDLPSGDVVSVQLKFAAGMTGTIAALSATPFYGRVAVFGSKGWAEAHEISHPDDPDPQPVQFFTCAKGQHRQEMTAIDPINTVLANFDAWADAVAGSGEYRFSNQERFANVAVLEAIARSAGSGKAEPVPALEI